MLTCKANRINYVLCLNEEAKNLFMGSKQELIESKCYDFMVYKVLDGYTGNLLDYNNWQEKMEIDMGTFFELHANLCQKIGRIVRQRNVFDKQSIIEV